MAFFFLITQMRCATAYPDWRASASVSSLRSTVRTTPSMLCWIKPTRWTLGSTTQTNRWKNSNKTNTRTHCTETVGCNRSFCPFSCKYFCFFLFGGNAKEKIHVFIQNVLIFMYAWSSPIISFPFFSLFQLSPIFCLSEEIPSLLCCVHTICSTRVL